MDFWVGPDDRDSEVNIVQIDQPQLGLPSRDYFLQPESQRNLAAYLEYMTEVQTIFLFSKDDYKKQKSYFLLTSMLQINKKIKIFNEKEVIQLIWLQSELSLFPVGCNTILLKQWVYGDFYVLTLFTVKCLCICGHYPNFLMLGSFCGALQQAGRKWNRIDLSFIVMYFPLI